MYFSCLASTSFTMHTPVIALERLASGSRSSGFPVPARPCVMTASPRIAAMLAFCTP